MITLHEEVNWVWKRKFTGATAIFLLNRHVELMFYLLLPFSDWIRWHENTVSTCSQSNIDCPLRFHMVHRGDLRMSFFFVNKH